MQSGGEAIDYINKIASLMTKMKDINIIGGKIGDQLKKVTSSKPYDYISKGLKFLFGRSTATTYYTTSKVYLETNGKITLSGTGTTTTPSIVDPITFNLQDILKKRATKSSSPNITKSIVKSNTDFETLGVWTINKSPCVYYHPLGNIYPTIVTKYDKVSITGKFTTPYFYYDTPEIIFNPAITQYIKSYKTDISFFNCLKANKETYLQSADDVYNSLMLETEYCDSEKEICSFNDYFEMEYQTVFSPEMLNEENTKVFYFNWGTILSGRLVAYISVEMDINYKGKEFKVYETRVYPVSYGLHTEPSIYEYHNPPYYFVVNIGNPYRDDLQYPHYKDLYRDYLAPLNKQENNLTKIANPK